MAFDLPLLNRRRRLTSGTNIRSLLFALSEPGVWYDPSDLTTMFQDRAGTTLVTTPGQSVGLVLDKRLGLTPGPELVGDPDLNGTGWWTVGSSTTISGGEAVAVNASNSATVLERLGLFTVGKTYQIEVTFSEVTQGGFGIFDGSTEFTGIVTAAVQTFTFRATPSGTTFRLRARGTSSTYKITRVSVREIPGNHAVAIADSSRGTYGIEPFGGRRNLLTFTEQFENAAWSRSGVTITPNAGVAPDDTQTADLVSPTTSAGILFRTPGNAPNQTLSCFVKPSGFSWVAFGTNTKDTTRAYFNLSGNGSVGYVGPVLTNANIVPLANSWYRISVTTTSTVDGIAPWAIWAVDGDAPFSVTPSGTSGILIWGAQVETGSTVTPYQRVTTAFDVTETGVPTVHYVQFDGADDGYLTSTITPGTDKAQVFAGVRKLSDVATGMLVELSANAPSGSGSFYITAPELAADAYKFLPRGTGNGGVIGVPLASYPAPITNLLTALADRSPASSIIRLDGTQVAQSTGSQGTGNYLAYPLYIGRRGGATLPFNGRLYQMVVRFGPNLDASRIAQVERFINSKTGAY